MKNYNILQISWDNWSQKYPLPEEFNWHFFSPGQMLELSTLAASSIVYDFIIIDDALELDYLIFLEKIIPCHRLIYNSTIVLGSHLLQNLFATKQAIALDFSNPILIINTILQVLISKAYQHFFIPAECHLQFERTHIVQHIGQYKTNITGSFGTTFRTIGNYRSPYIAEYDQIIDIWPVFSASQNIAVRYQFTLYQIDPNGNTSQEIFYYQEENFEQPYTIFLPENSQLHISIDIKGEGQFSLGNLFFRNSYVGLGHGLVGGRRLVTDQREEIFYYFNSGTQANLLNVYFTNQATRYFLQDNFFLQQTDTPYLIISDARFEGNGFYIGNQTIETAIINLIQEHLHQLKLSSSDCIFSGIDRGAFAALYYGSLLLPHTILLGNPILHLGTIALDEATVNPQKSSAILDILQELYPHYSSQTCHEWDQKLLHQFKNTDWTPTSFAFASVKTDTLDPNAYTLLTEALIANGNATLLTSKQFTTNQEKDRDILAEWFYTQYATILSKWKSY